MRSHWRLVTAAMMASGLVALTSAAPALAQKKPVAAKAPPAAKPLTDKQKKDKARTEYKEGERLFKLGSYAAAFEHYKTADDILPIAATKYKLAVCSDKQGKLVEAAGYYRAFLDASPAPDKFAEAISDSRTRLEAIKKIPGKVKVFIDPPGVANLALQIDNGQVMPPPPDRSLTMPPGNHRITATAPGYDPASITVDLSFAESREIRLMLVARPKGAPPPPPFVAVGPQQPPPPAQPPGQTTIVTVRPRSRLPSYILFGATGAGVVVGSIFGAMALGAKSDFNKPTGHTVENADRAESNARISDISFGLGIACGIVGTVLLFVPRDRAATTGENEQLQKTASPRGFITPYAGPNGGGAAALLTF